MVRQRLSFKENGVATTCAFTDSEHRSSSLHGPATAVERPRDSARLIDCFCTYLSVSSRVQAHAHRQGSRRAGGDWTLHTGAKPANCGPVAQAARLMCDQKLSDSSVNAVRARRDLTVGEHKSADRPLCRRCCAHQLLRAVHRDGRSIRGAACSSLQLGTERLLAERLLGTTQRL